MRKPLLPIVSVLLVLLPTGCGVSVTYHYVIGIDRPSVPAPGYPAGFVLPQADAVIEVEWNGGRTTAVLSDYEKAKHVVFSERLAPPLSPIVFSPRGFRVRVTKEGYEPWEADYRDDRFACLQDDRTDLHRIDTITMQPVSSPLPTTRTSGTP